MLLYLIGLLIERLLNNLKHSKLNRLKHPFKTVKIGNTINRKLNSFSITRAVLPSSNNISSQTLVVFMTLVAQRLKEVI